MSSSAEEILAAADAGDCERVKRLIRDGADACFQDVSGKSALMAAADKGHCEVLYCLLQAGAPWNAFDKQGRCAGEYATSNGHEAAARVLLEAGVRAELVLGAVDRASRPEAAPEQSDSGGYLRQRLEYGSGGDGGEVLSDAEDKAVMMAWEGPLMQAHARAICSRGGDILNVGFGLGLVDEAIQQHVAGSDGSNSLSLPPVTSHTIIEAHPDVLARMRSRGWNQKPGVKILSGRWQDVLIGLDQQFDGIFFDTYSEYYEDLRDFHSLLPKLLKPEGLYSYFNGLSADNPFFHAVSCEVCCLELASLGLDTQFVSLPVDVSSPEVWRKIANKYWQLDTYLLPVCEWAEETLDPPNLSPRGGA